MLISLDTECNGLDLRHSARPFFVAVAREDGEQLHWCWDVDPLTRKPEIPADDLDEIRAEIANADRIVMHNAKFDVTSLSTIGIEVSWDKVEDTLIASHLLSSNTPHDLTSLAMQYLAEDIQPLEDALEKAVQEGRRMVQQARLRIKRGKEGNALASWVIAGKGVEGMPSAKEEAWRSDFWLPRAFIAEWKSGRLMRPFPGKDLIDKHAGWETVLRDYANADSAVTLALWQVMRGEMERRWLWEIYRARMQGLAVAHRIECAGVTISKPRTEQLKRQFTDSAERCRQRCVELSGGSLTDLPVNGASKALQDTVFGKLGLSHPKRTQKGNASMDKYVLDDWLVELEEGSTAHEFIRNLVAYRKRKTALGYIDAYEKFWLPSSPPRPGCFILHPSLNPTGTVTLRCSSSNPNGQQVSQQEIETDGEESHSARYMFGPAPGREWWSMDGQNLELRIPAYEAGETDLIRVFDRPNDPPYFGSYHLAICDLLWPKEFKEHGGGFKETFKTTLYRRAKNGNFSVLYGAQQRKADATYGVPGAYEKIRRRFPKIAALSDRMKAQADRQGYVETIPDKTVNPKRGYPILCSRSENGAVMPTTPLNYHVQSSACWWMMKAMIRCDEWLRESKSAGKIVLQVHDELVVDFPKGRDGESNLPAIRRLQKLMEEGGADLGVPTPVSISYHPDNWGEGQVIA